MRVSMSIDIDASPELVWPYLVEPEKTRAWFGAARRSGGLGWAVSAENFAWTSDTRGVGSTFRWSEEDGGSKLSIEFETTEWEPPHVFGYRMTTGAMYKSYDGRWVIDGTSSGSRFTFQDHVEFSYGPFGKLIGLFAARTARKTGRAVLDNLKRLVEADAD